VLAGKRRFTVDECMEMLEAGVLHEDDRIELIDGELLIMAPIGDNHDNTTDWLNELCVHAFGGRARVRVQGSIRLNNMSAPQPDIAILRRRPLGDARPYYPQDIFVVIEVANTSLRYDSGPKLARYAAAGIVEVWVVNLQNGTVTVYTGLSGLEYTNVRTYLPGESVSPQAFPDVSLAVDDFVAPPESFPGRVSGCSRFCCPSRRVLRRNGLSIKAGIPRTLPICRRLR
jgi:Uma2 family endonuclease